MNETQKNAVEGQIKKATTEAAMADETTDENSPTALLGFETARAQLAKREHGERGI